MLGCHEDQGNGRCFNGTCVCLPEFEGKYCESEVDEFLEPYWERRDPLGWAMIITLPTVAVGALILLCTSRYKKRRIKAEEELTLAEPVEGSKLKPDKLVAVAKPVRLPIAQGSSALDAPLLPSPAYEVPDSHRSWRNTKAGVARALPKATQAASELSSPLGTLSPLSSPVDTASVVSDLGSEPLDLSSEATSLTHTLSSVSSGAVSSDIVTLSTVDQNDED